uniref:Uncharacterized protein n=1 Tax=Solanum lycopersicum TaxID=4081 RepID=A0A3Q7J4D1_SOLLC
MRRNSRSNFVCFQVDKFISLWSGKPFRDDYERRILASLDIRQLSRDGRMRNPDEKRLVLPQAQTVAQPEIVEKTTVKPSKEESEPAQKVNKEKNTKKTKDASSNVTDTKEKNTKKPKDASSKVTETNYIFDIEEEIHGLEKQPKDVKPKNKETDEAKLKEMKREEEIVKNRQLVTEEPVEIVAEEVNLEENIETPRERQEVEGGKLGIKDLSRIVEATKTSKKDS